MPGFVSNVTERSVSVQNNRLSGRIPSSLVHLQNVSVLGSNMFACKIDKSDLPKHDSDRDNYQCGSDEFNDPFYVALALIAVAGLTFAVSQCRCTQSCLTHIRSRLRLWRLEAATTPIGVQTVLRLSDVLCRIGVCCTALIVVLLVPWYAAASHYYGTYAHQYAWVVSAGFLSGVTPLAVEFVLYTIVLLAFVGVACVHIPARTARPRTDTGSPVHEERRLTGTDVLVYIAFLAVNLFTVIGVNAGFVAVALTQSNAVLVLAQIVLSVFKLLWNTVCTPYLVSLAAQYTSPGQAKAGDGLVTVQVFIGLFNNIAIPCLVVAVLSPSCFYGVFDAAPAVTSNYFTQTCLIEANFEICTYLKPLFATSTFSPPFRYDYQCSSSFITYYAPAFVYLGLAASAASPAVVLFCRYAMHLTAPGTGLQYALSCVVPRLLLPEHELRDSTRTALPSSTAFPLFDVNGYIIPLVTYLGILLTFGVVFPPLAVVMCVTMLSVAWQTKLSLGRFLHFAREQGAPQLAEALDRDCKGAVSLALLPQSVSLIASFACCFYALFLFDTLGDAVGLSGAYWVLIAVPLFPLLTYVAYLAHSRLRTNGAQLEEPKLEDSAFTVELGQRVCGAAMVAVDRAEATMNALRDP